MGEKSTLLLVIAEKTNQFKWLWLQTPGKSESWTQLMGIQKFDATSRGPPGSLLMFTQHRALKNFPFGAIYFILL